MEAGLPLADERLLADEIDSCFKHGEVYRIPTPHSVITFRLE
jgi:hypothetical protein